MTRDAGAGKGGFSGYAAVQATIGPKQVTSVINESGPPVDSACGTSNIKVMPLTLDVHPLSFTFCTEGSVGWSVGACELLSWTIQFTRTCWCD